MFEYKDGDLDLLVYDMAPFEEAYLVFDRKTRSSMTIAKAEVEVMMRRQSLKLVS